MPEIMRLRVKEIAEQKGISRKEIERKSGVTPQLLHRYWNNYVQSVSFDPLIKIAKVLGVKPPELLECIESTSL